MKRLTCPIFAIVTIIGVTGRTVAAKEGDQIADLSWCLQERCAWWVKATSVDGDISGCAIKFNSIK